MANQDRSVVLPASTSSPSFRLLPTPSILQAGERQLTLSSPVCMGILNITPDSFSDGAELARSDRSEFRFDRDKVLFKAAQMVRDGALILDVGGESTRPGASPVPVDEELDRTIPVLEILRAEFDVLLSIDTSTPEVMSAALAAGAGLVNDVRALTCAGAMQVVAEAQAAPAVCSDAHAGPASIHAGNLLLWQRRR